MIRVLEDWEEPGAVRPFELVRLNDRPPRPKSWIVRGVIGEDNCILLSAAQKTGKTFFTFELAICVANGRPFFGHTVEQRGAALFYSPESGLEDRRRRLWGLARGARLDPAHALADVVLIGERMNLGIAEHCDRLAATVRAVEPVITVVDPFVCAAAGVDENAAGEVQPILDRLRDACAGPGRALVLAHHTNKGRDQTMANSVRGSSAFGGWWDGFVSIRRSDPDDWACVRNVDVEQKDARSVAPWGFRIDSLPYPAGGPEAEQYRLEACDAVSGRGAHNAVDAAQRRSEIAALVRDEPSIGQAEIARRVGVTPRTVRRHLATMAGAA